jgi:siroheme synthase-like protein
MSTRAPVAGYPVNLIVEGRRCVVVGAGRVATRKIEALLDAGARVEVVALDASPQVVAWAEEGRLVLALRAFVPDDLDRAWLATTATGDALTDGAVFRAGDERGVWVNAADDPAHCSFTLMSVVRQGDIVVAVGTGGRSPAFAAWLRGRLAQEIGTEYATVLELLAEARADLRREGRPTQERGWQKALDSGMLDLVRAGHTDDAKELLVACLSS